MQALKDVFDRNFHERMELGASVSVYRDGEKLVSYSAGWCEKEQVREWTDSTLVPVYSATKGPAAVTLMTALEKAGLSPATPVREVWGKFPVAANFGQLMSHQVGLPALDQVADVFDFEAVVESIEAQKPAWPLGSAHGYHPRTYGYLLDHPVRLLTGQSLGEFWRSEIADGLGLDFWIGLPEELEPRVAKLYPGKMDKKDMDGSPFYSEFLKRGTLVQRAFASPRGLHSVAEMNTREAHESGLPAMGGIGTADSLACFYQALLGTPVGEGPGISEKVRSWILPRQVQGEDQIMKLPTAFHYGFMGDPIDTEGRKIRQLYGPNLSAFGHPGSGGSVGFCDPETGISFAYVMNQMELSLFPGVKSLDMIEALYSSL